ncbi:MAG: class I SAM-dependent rRNA methyltransferase [Candidatus Omnitrophica bacterium]|nr:class I SAM-dependent rRNA methyltransferase [Candidatus Omnitrophota bacterium]
MKRHTRNTIQLKARKEIPIKAGHPWVFSEAILSGRGESPGEIVRVTSHKNEFLGIGTWNGLTSIRVRILARDEDAEINEEFFAGQFQRLEKRKHPFLPHETNGYRLVNADADSLPGLIVDRYDDVCVFQIHTAGMELFRQEIIGALDDTFSPRAIVERSDLEIRRREGLKDMIIGVHKGEVEGPVLFKECGLSFYADVLEGQKTGFFLDQRDARRRTGAYAAGRNVLNLFGYTGAFSLYAASGGAKGVTMVESSRDAIDIAGEHFRINNLPAGSVKNVKADVFDFLSELKKTAPFDMVICDPPAFAKTRGKIAQALKAYTGLNMRCLGLLRGGGILITSSCSGRVTEEDFLGALRIAAGLAARDVQVLEVLGQPPDHTTTLAFPEGRYLNTVILQVLEKTEISL